MKCKDCRNETIDPHRYCSICNAYLCWDHVTRIAITVHDQSGATWEIPIYLCREHLNNCLGNVLKSKYERTPSIPPCRPLLLEKIMHTIGTEYTPKEP